MARKKVTEVTEYSAPDPEPLPEGEETLLEQDADEDNIWGGLEKKSTIKVRRVNQYGKKQFLAELEPPVTEAQIQELFGEGHYELHAYDSKRNNKGVRVVDVGPRLPKPGENGPAPAAAPAVPGMHPDVQVQIELMREQIRSDREVLLELIRNQTNGQGQHSTFTEVAAAMASLKEVVATSPPAFDFGKLVTELIPLVKSLIELGANGGGGEKSGMSIFKEILAEVPGVLKQFGGTIAAANPTATRPAQAAQPAIPAAASAAPPVIAGVDPRTVALLKSGLDYLKTRCHAGQDPAFWAEFTTNTLDNEQSRQLAKLLDRPFEEVAAIDPELQTAAYVGWFQAYFAELKDELLQRNDSAGPAGDENHAGENAGPGPRVVPFGSTDTPKGA